MKNTGTRWSALLIGAFALVFIIVMMVSTTKSDSQHATSAAVTKPQQSPTLLIVAPAAQPNLAPVYRHSVIPGGVRHSSELASALAQDQYARAHFVSFNAAKAYLVHAKAPRMVHVSYRMGENIYWTKKKVRIPAGEALLTDGQSLVRARCGNRISDTAQPIVSDQEPAPEVLDMVIAPNAALEGARQSTSSAGRRNGPLGGASNGPETFASASGAPRPGSPSTGAPSAGGLPPLAGAPMPGTFFPPAVEPKPGPFPAPTVEPKPGVVPPPIDAPKPGPVPPPGNTPDPVIFPPPTDGPFPPPVTVLPPALTPPVTDLPPPLTPPVTDLPPPPPVTDLPPPTVPENPTPIPEPATFALVVLALISMILMQQRRRPQGKKALREVDAVM